MNKYYIILSALWLSCSDTTEELYNSSDIPVVESVVFENQGPTVKLTKLIPYNEESDETALPLSGLEVYISDGTQDYLLEESETGLYSLDTDQLTLHPSMNYQLHFDYGSATIEGNTDVPERPVAYTNVDEVPLEEISDFTQISGVQGDQGQLTVSWDEAENAYYLVQLLYTSSSYNQVIDFFPIEDPEEAGKFTSTPIQGTSHTFNDRQLLFFGSYDIVVHRITEDYASLYESLNNSSLDEISEPYSNIINGKGIFTAISSDTVQIQVTRL